MGLYIRLALGVVVPTISSLGVCMNCDLNNVRRCFQPRWWFAKEGEPDPFIVADEDSFMWVYREDKGRDGWYQVGYFAPDGTWFQESDHSDRVGAAARVNHLNGGRSG